MTDNHQLADQLLAWYKQHGRKNLPWQATRDPYPIWISEIMLQQTQVTTVIDYFERFIKRFPSVQSLARAPVDEVLALWSGLGYYARARNLHKAAGMIVDRYDGVMPAHIDELMSLPGIGRSTAGAILAFAHNQRHPILDGNVKRVLCRYYAIDGYPGKRKIENQLWRLADDNTPAQQVSQYTQAIMDLGATLCLKKNPQCDCCPLSGACRAHEQGIQNLLPVSKPKNSLPVKQLIMIIVYDKQNRILLEKRPAAGIWGGLWSLPECAVDSDIVRHCKHNLGLDVQLQAVLPDIKHSFSHYRLIIQPHRATATRATAVGDDNTNWFSLDKALKLGLPKPVKSLLSQMETGDE